jgi:galactokinase
VEADAPGRVNLIGEHTDYNDGFVLPIAIPQRAKVALGVRSDVIVQAHSAQFDSSGILRYSLGGEAAGKDWLDYIQGISWVLRLEGQLLNGFDLCIDSSIPLGSGLASSAALEVSLLRGLRGLFGLRLDDLQLARLSQRAENEFVGAQVGIMDQLAASLGEESGALLVDTRDLTYQKVPLPDVLELAVIDSGVKHSNARGEYNTRRRECERACALLGVQQLRQLGRADLRRVDDLPPPLNRRTRHVITENERVLAAVQAMRVGDVAGLGSLLYQSHQSLRHDYEVSTPELDLLVELAKSEVHVYGARLTGGGFGGSVILLVRRGAGRVVAERVAREYEEQAGRRGFVLLPAA